MSHQFNFFALDEDVTSVCQTLIDKIPEMCAVAGEGREADLVPSDIRSCDDLLRKAQVKKVFVFPRAYAARLIFRPRGKDMLRVDFRSSPVVEYIPSCVTAEGYLRVGRLYCGFGGDPGLVRLLDQAIRKLKRSAVKLPQDPHFWIFPHAAHHARLLQFWVGGIKANPLYGGGRSVSSEGGA